MAPVSGDNDGSNKVDTKASEVVPKIIPQTPDVTYEIFFELSIADAFEGTADSGERSITPFVIKMLDGLRYYQWSRQENRFIKNAQKNTYSELRTIPGPFNDVVTVVATDLIGLLSGVDESGIGSAENYRFVFHSLSINEKDDDRDRIEYCIEQFPIQEKENPLFPWSDEEREYWINLSTGLMRMGLYTIEKQEKFCQTKRGHSILVSVVGEYETIPNSKTYERIKGTELETRLLDFVSGILAEPKQIAVLNPTLVFLNAIEL